MSTASPARGIALGGFMGSGKSTLGRALAARLGWPFVDTDAVLAERFGPIADQFREDGEAAFRERERAVIAELCVGGPRVLATGGGAWVDPRNRQALRSRYLLVVLDADWDVLRARAGHDEDRPLWDDAVRARYAARAPAYADADLTLDTGAISVEDAVQEVTRWVHAQ